MGSHNAQIPTSFGKELRACLRCCLVKTYSQFTDAGCENCPFFNMDQDNDRVLECTTAQFSGIIASMEPTGSWAARWQRISKHWIAARYALVPLLCANVFQASVLRVVTPSLSLVYFQRRCRLSVNIIMSDMSPEIEVMASGEIYITEFTRREGGLNANGLLSGTRLKAIDLN